MVSTVCARAWKCQAGWPKKLPCCATRKSTVPAFTENFDHITRKDSFSPPRKGTTASTGVAGAPDLGAAGLWARCDWPAATRAVPNKAMHASRPAEDTRLTWESKLIAFHCIRFEGSRRRQVAHSDSPAAPGRDAAWGTRYIEPRRKMSAPAAAVPPQTLNLHWRTHPLPGHGRRRIHRLEYGGRTGPARPLRDRARRPFHG